MFGVAAQTEETVNARIIRALVDARREAKVRQIDLAQRIGQPQSFISRYETGERRIDVGQFVAISHALAADPIELLTRVLRET